MKIADLFARIGIKADTGKLDTFKKQLTNVKNVAVGVGGAATAVSVILGKISKDAMDAAASFKQFEAETGASSQELQKWQSVAEQTNNSAKDLEAGIKAIAANREALRLGKGSIAGYQLLGIDPNQDPFEVLEDLRGKIGELPEAMQKNVLAQMGLSSSLLQVLNLSNEAFDDMAGRAFIIPESAINSLDRARSGVVLMKESFKFIKTMIAAGLTPNVQKMSKAFADFIKQNEKKIVKFAQDLAGWITKLGKAIFTVIGFINRLIQATIGFKGAAIVLIGIFTALNASVMLPVAGILLLVALIEDIVVYSRGGDSLIGKLFEFAPNLEKVFLGIAKVIKEIVEAIAAIVTQDMGKFDEIIEKWGAIGVVVDFWRDRIVALKGAIESLMELDFESALDKLAEGFGGGFSLLAGIEDLATGEGTFGEILRERATQGFSQSALGGLSRAGQQLIEKIDINIDGSGDPEATGNAVVRALQGVFNKTADQRGVVE